jgi:hypothetical protein
MKMFWLNGHLCIEREPADAPNALAAVRADLEQRGVRWAPIDTSGGFSGSIGPTTRRPSPAVSDVA